MSHLPASPHCCGPQLSPVCVCVCPVQICALSSERQDDELKYDCRVTLACMAQAMLPPDVIPVLLSTISQVRHRDGGGVVFVGDEIPVVFVSCDVPLCL